MVQLAAFMAVVLMLVYFWPVFLAVLAAVVALAVIGALAGSSEPRPRYEYKPVLPPEQTVTEGDILTFIGGWFALTAFFALLAYVWN